MNPVAVFLKRQFKVRKASHTANTKGRLRTLHTHGSKVRRNGCILIKILPEKDRTMKWMCFGTTGNDDVTRRHQ